MRLPEIKLQLIENISSKEGVVNLFDIASTSVYANIQSSKGTINMADLSISSLKAVLSQRRHHTQRSSDYFNVPLYHSLKVDNGLPTVFQTIVETAHLKYSDSIYNANTILVDSVSSTVVDYAIDNVLELALSWYETALATILLLVTKNKQLTSRRDILLESLLNSLKQGDLKELASHPENMGEIRLDPISAMLTFARLAFDSVKKSPKWLFLVENRSPLHPMMENLRSLTSMVLSAWGLEHTQNSNLPAWLESTNLAAKPPFPPLVQINFVVSSLVGSIFDSSGISGGTRLENIALEVLAKSVINHLQISALWSCPVFQFDLKPKLIAYLVDWVHTSSVLGKILLPSTEVQEKVQKTTANISYRLLCKFGISDICLKTENATAGLQIVNMMASLSSIGQPNEKQLISMLLVAKSMTAVLSEKFEDATESIVSLALGPISSLFTLSDSRLAVLCRLKSIVASVPKSLVNIQIFFERLIMELSLYKSVFLYTAAPKVYSQPIELFLDLDIPLIEFQSQILTNFNFNYQVQGYFISIHSKSISAALYRVVYEYRLAQQALVFPKQNAEPYLLSLPASFSRGSVDFCAKRGNIWDKRISVELGLENIDQQIDIELVDGILAAYTLLMSDLRDTIKLVAHFANERSISNRAAPVENGIWDLDLRVVVKDSGCVAKSPHGDILLKSKMVSATALVSAEKFSWKLDAEGMTLSMLQFTTAVLKEQFCSANIDFKFQQTTTDTSNNYAVSSEQLYVILRAASIDRAAKILEYWKGEILARNYQRASELLEFTSGAKAALNSLQVAYLTPKPLKAVISAWDLEFKHISLVVTIGGKFATPGLFTTSLRDVLMISCKNLKIASNHSSKWEIKDIYIAFCNSYDISQMSHFDPDNHQLVNFALLPHVMMNVSQTLDRFIDYREAVATVDILIVKVDPSFAEQLKKLMGSFQRDPAVSKAIPNVKGSSVKSIGRTLINIESSLLDNVARFLQVHCKLKCKGSELTLLPASKKIEEIDTLRFPGLVLLVDGKAAIVKNSFLSRNQVIGVCFDLTYEPFENSIHPDTAVFFTNIWNSFLSEPLAGDDLREKQITLAREASSEWSDEYDGFLAKGDYQVSFILRLAKSKMNLWCNPYSAVAATLGFQSALFLITYVPRSTNKYVNVTANFFDINFVLRHQVSPEDCVKAESTRVDVHLTMETTPDSTSYVCTLSIPKSAMQLNMRQLHEWLLFQRLWIPSRMPDEPSSCKKSATSTSRYCLVFSLGAIDALIDFGPSVGRFKLDVEDFVGCGEQRYDDAPTEHHLNATIARSRIDLQGRLSGDVFLEGLEMMIFSIDPQKSVSEQEGVACSLVAERISVQFMQQFERILIFESQKISLGLRDLRDAPILLIVSIVAQDIALCISKSTFPSIVDLSTRLTSLIEDKQALAAKTFALLRSPLTKRQISHGFVERKGLQIDETSGLANIQLEVIASSLTMTFTGDSFRQPDCVQLSSTNIHIILKELPKSPILFDESVSFAVGTFLLRKVQLKNVSPTEERMWTIQQWLSFLAVSRGVTIVFVPAMTIDLATESFFPERRVDYSLGSTFSKGVDVALNLGFYKFAQQLISVYIENAPLISAGRSQKIPLSQWKFKQTGKLEFNPPLLLTGDATPKDFLKAIGLGKESIPKVVYQMAISLIEFAHGTGNIYKKVFIPAKEEEFHSPIEDADSEVE